MRAVLLLIGRRVVLGGPLGGFGSTGRIVHVVNQLTEDNSNEGERRASYHRKSGAGNDETDIEPCWIRRE